MQLAEFWAEQVVLFYVTEEMGSIAKNYLKEFINSGESNYRLLLGRQI